MYCFQQLNLNEMKKTLKDLMIYKSILDDKPDSWFKV